MIKYVTRFWELRCRMITQMNLCNLFALLLIVAISLPILISITYVVPGSDDFCVGNTIEKLREHHSSIVSSLIFMKNTYISWQGTYFGIFVWGFQPNFHNSYFAYRALLFCSFIVFVIVLFLYSLVFAKVLLKLSTISSYILSVIIAILALNTTSGGEWFTWNTGCAVYQIPMICYLFGLIAQIVFYSKKNNFLIIISVLFSLLAAGGSLAVTALGSSLLFLTLIFAFDKKNLKSKYNLSFQL